MDKCGRGGTGVQAKRNGEQGYLLIEAVVVLFIVSTILGAIAAIFTQSLRAITAAERVTAAAVIAQEQIELLKSSDDHFWATIVFPYQNGPAAIVGTSFYQTIKAEISPADANQHIIKLTVIIEHPGAEQVMLVTYLLREIPQLTMKEGV